MPPTDTIGLGQFIRDYPAMAIRPSADAHLRLKGTFRFKAQHESHGEISDAFALQIDVPRGFPREVPTVRELAGRIPRTRKGDFHVNGDGTLCLGSPLRLLLKIQEQPTLTGFAASCIVPYLYAISHKLHRGGPLLFGELAHEGPGILTDYMAVFGLKSQEAAGEMLRLLGMKKRIANKRACPCGCGIRVGRCRINRRINSFRKIASRNWFKQQLLCAGVQD